MSESDGAKIGASTRKDVTEPSKFRCRFVEFF